MKKNKKLNNNALIVMVRVPEVGKVKTRLIPELGEVGACQLYKCMLEDLFHRLLSLKGVDIFIFYTGEVISKEFTSTVPKEFILKPQEGRDLGARMFKAIDSLFANNAYSSITVIGSDSPDIPLEIINNSFTLLNGVKEDKVVISPATDGGYCLIGTNFSTDAPFKDIDWGAGSVFEATVSNLEETGIAYEVLDQWHDIDESEDLKCLKNNKETPKSSLFMAKLDL